jgi:streptogramin lyase
MSSQPVNISAAPSEPKWPLATGAVRLGLATASSIGITSGVSQLLTADLLHLAFVVIGIELAAMSGLALRMGRPPAEHRRFLVALGLAGVLFSAWAAKYPATPASKGPVPKQQPSQRSAARPSLIVGAPISVGVRPRAIARGNDGLWVVTAGGVSHYDQRDTDAGMEAFAIPGRRPFDLAVRGGRIVVVIGGTAQFLNTRTGQETRRPLHFSEAPGHVALTDDATWLCNVTHSKVERFDAKTGALTSLPVPGVPTAIIADGNTVWVGVDAGWVVHFNQFGSELGRYRVPQDVGPMAVGFGLLWVAHPERRIISRVSLASGRRLASSIPVAADIQAMTVSGDSLWAVSGATDTLQRIDLRRHRLVDEISVPAGPEGVAAYRGRLWVTSTQTGWLSPIWRTRVRRSLGR